MFFYELTGTIFPYFTCLCPELDYWYALSDVSLEHDAILGLLTHPYCQIRGFEFWMLPVLFVLFMKFLW
jgi:hypothetical protein